MKRVAFVVGGALVAIGLRELLGATSMASLRSFATWFVGGVVLHDGVLVPVTLLAGLALTRLVSGTYRGLVQGGLIISGTVTLALLPLLSGRGRTADNLSQQPLSYGRNLLLVLAAVWTVAALLAFRRRSAARRIAVPGGMSDERSAASAD